LSGLYDVEISDEFAACQSDWCDPPESNDDQGMGQDFSAALHFEQSKVSDGSSSSPSSDSVLSSPERPSPGLMFLMTESRSPVMFCLFKESPGCDLPRHIPGDVLSTQVPLQEELRIPSSPPEDVTSQPVRRKNQVKKGCGPDSKRDECGRDNYPYQEGYFYKVLSETLGRQAPSTFVRDFVSFAAADKKDGQEDYLRQVARKELSPANRWAKRRMPCAYGWLDENKEVIVRGGFLVAFMQGPGRGKL
jgi:hypothetical protein